MRIPRENLRLLLKQIARTQPEELDCNQVYQLLDEFAERAAYGDDVAALIPLVQHHLELCLDCHEECEALLRILRANSSVARNSSFWDGGPDQAIDRAGRWM